MLATCDVYRAHRHGSESPHPGSTPGLNPCNHLTRQACGPWRTHRHNTYIQTRRLRRHEGLMIHRIRRAAQPRRRGHHRAEGRRRGGPAVAAEAGAVRAGEQLSEIYRRWGRRGSLDKGVGASPPVVDRSSEASSDGEAKGHPDHRGEPGWWVPNTIPP